MQSVWRYAVLVDGNLSTNITIDGLFADTTY